MVYAQKKRNEKYSHLHNHYTRFIYVLFNLIFEVRFKMCTFVVSDLSEPLVKCIILIKVKNTNVVPLVLQKH